MSDIIPHEVIIRGDSRNSRLTLEYLQRELATLRLTPAAPEVVAHEIFIAKRVFLAGWFFYELFANSFHHAAVACESALRERYVRDLVLPIELEARRVDTNGQRPTRVLTDRPEAATLSEMLRRTWRLRVSPEFRFDYSRLIEWATRSGAISSSSSGCVDNFRQWRNMSAHGSIAVLPPGPLLNVMQEAVWIINEVFPDPDTDAYDGPRKAAHRAAQAEEHQRRRERNDDLGSST